MRVADRCGWHHQLRRSSLYFLLLNDPLYHLCFAPHAIQGNSTRRGWEEAQNPKRTTREVVRGSSRYNDLADFERVLGHGTSPKEPMPEHYTKTPSALCLCSSIRF
jgi:hypothetical protein